MVAVELKKTKCNNNPYSKKACITIFDMMFNLALRVYGVVVGYV